MLFISAIKLIWEHVGSKSLVVVALAFISSAMTLTAPVMLGAAVTSLANSNPREKTLALLIAYAALFFVSKACSSLGLFVYGRLEQAAQTEIVAKALTKSNQLNPVARARLNDSELAFAIDGAGQGFCTIFNSVARTSFNALFNVVIGAIILWLNVGGLYAFEFLIVCLLFILVSKRPVRKHQDASKLSMEKATRAFGALQNSLNTWRDTRLHNQAEFIEQRYRKKRRPFETVIQKAYLHSIELSLFQAIVLYLGLFALLVTFLYDAGFADKPGSLVTIAGVVLSAVLPLEMLGFGLSQISVGMGQNKALVEKLTPDPADASPNFLDYSISESTSYELKVPAIQATVPDESVTSTLPELDLQPGRPIWLTAPSGGGKTIALDALTRLTQLKTATESKLAVPARPPHAATAAAPAAHSKVQFAYYRQDGELLEDTIECNIRYGRDDVDVPNLLKQVGLADTPTSIKQRLQQIGAGDGSRISGGERTRVKLARVLGTDADLYLFDEPTTGLGKEHRELIWKELTELAQRKLVVIATHDPEAPILPDDQVIRPRTIQNSFSTRYNSEALQGTA